MRILLNGEGHELPTGATVADVVAALGRDPDRPGAAVVVDEEVVPRSGWRTAVLREGVHVEVVEAVQGG